VADHQVIEQYGTLSDETNSLGLQMKNEKTICNKAEKG
jgi:hypothetical protein